MPKPKAKTVGGLSPVVKRPPHINNRVTNGIAYDWQRIADLYHTLNCPSMYYDPTEAPIDKVRYIVEVSERATGKTTNWILYALCMYVLYGTILVYCRTKTDMIMPKNAAGLFAVIVENGYIDKLTGGKYNNVCYKSRRWYFTRVDETGQILEQAPTHFAVNIALDKVQELKSSFNEPTGDIILFDEFITLDNLTDPEEFHRLVDAVSTVFRGRYSGRVVMLANTIDINNQYFHELEIYNHIRNKKPGFSAIFTASGGTKTYYHFIDCNPAYRAQKDKWVELYAGFEDPRLNAVKGREGWATKWYPHITEQPDKVLFQKLFISYAATIMQVKFVRCKDSGDWVYIHFANYIPSDAIVFTVDKQPDTRYIWGMGEYTRIGNILKDMIMKRRVKFSANDVGHLFEQYLQVAKTQLFGN